jgi:hypothetical protein
MFLRINKGEAMKTVSVVIVGLVASLGLAQGVARAQSEEAAAEPPPATPPAATPTATIEEAAPAEEASATSGWFRVDTDSLGTQFWLGATHDLGGVAIASDIYVVGSFAEFDIGPSFSFGNLALTPMVGIGFDFATTDVASLIAPQLFSIYDMDKLYFESWIQVFLNSPFAEGAADIAYTRNFLLYKASDAIAIGPQVEVSYRVNDFDGDMETAAFDTGIVSLPVGGRVNLGYGKNNTLGLFLGYETEEADGADAIAGRFTFVRTW